MLLLSIASSSSHCAIYLFVAQISALVRDRKDRKSHTKTPHAKSGLILSEDAPQVAKMLLAQISALVQDREDRKNHTKTLHAKSGLILSEDAPQAKSRLILSEDAPQVAKILVARISALVQDREDGKSHTKTLHVFCYVVGQVWTDTE
ncbi:hypothetical protein J6590_004991 [Homalodisca vitripennis]|nr:hypothetical protein J6590_004991 [Homalodisca vitripennis]